MRNRKEYVHLRINETVARPDEPYTVIKEMRLDYRGREVLCVVRRSDVETCCGGGFSKYVMVLGYIARWHLGVSKDRLALSEVEPISNMQVRNDLRRTIKEREGLSSVRFW